MKPLPLQPQGTMYVTKGGRGFALTQEEIDEQREIYNIRTEIQAERQAAIIEANTRRLCKEILDSEIAGNYPNFIRFVTEFIRGVEHNQVNPNIVYDHHQQDRPIARDRVADRHRPRPCVYGR